LIQNTENDKVYVGGSCSIGSRLHKHTLSLRNNDHHNNHLQNAWNKYGEEKFSFHLLEETDENPTKQEQYWMDNYMAYDRNYGYNLSLTAGVHTPCEESRQKMSISRKRYKQSIETIEKARKANTGQKRTVETRLKLKKVRMKNIEKTSDTVRKNGSRKKSASNYKGVYRHRDKWQARIKLNDEFLYLGRFETEEEAAKNFDFHVLQFLGEEYYVNFPDYDYTNFIPKKTIKEVMDKQVRLENIQRNKRLKPGKTNAGSEYKGVYKRKNNWEGSVRQDGKLIHVGSFDTQEEAAHNYDYHMLQIYGKDNCYLNFPDFDYENFTPKTLDKNPNYGPNKLSKDKARVIREKHDEGIKPTELAEEYEVTLASIYRVLRNVTYKEPNLKCSGSATIQVQYYDSAYFYKGKFSSQTEVELIKADQRRVGEVSGINAP